MPATQALPPPRAIFAVDTEKFTSNPSARQPQLRDAITELLSSAFARSGLVEIWEARTLPQGTGDGFVFAVPQERTPFLLDPLLDRFQEVLEEHDRLLRSEDRGLRLRLRVAVHMGSVSGSDGRREGIGTPMNDTFRLLDSAPLKQELSQSNPDITLLAAIVSQRVFEDVVRAGFTPGLPPGRFKPVIAEVAGKEFVQPAWVYIPKPSRASDRPAGTVDGQHGTRSDGSDPAGQASGGTTIHGGVGNSITGGDFSAEVRQQIGGSES
jgi:class 3 adenylate cyclase